MGPRELTELLLDRGVSARVVEAMASVPRDSFVPRELRAHAWEDRPLPIGHGQTISQPSLVGLMTDALAVGPGANVLDVGTGSGYQAAVLAALGARVHSLERIKALADRAAATLGANARSVVVKWGDGTLGWPELGPFDAIVVAAAADSIPPALLEQLAPAAMPEGSGGRLLLPLRDSRTRSRQRLVLVERTSTGLSQRDLLDVAFVPLVAERRP